MIRVERVGPDWIERMGFRVEKEVVERSVEIWAVYADDVLTFVGGAVKCSMIGSTRIWLVAVEPNWKALRAARSILGECRRRFGALLAMAEPGRDTRFAEWCGFRAEGEHDGYVRLTL